MARPEDERYRFGVWGIALDDDAFADALAGAGMDGAVENGVVQFRTPVLPPSIDAVAARSAWSAAQASVSHIEILDRGDLDPAWLAAVLSRALRTRIGGVYFRRDEPDVPVAWDWPLRIGLLADDRSSDLRDAIAGSRLQRLVRFVDVGQEPAECELFLLPCNLRSSVERVLAMSAPVSADCTIVLGGAKSGGERVEPLMSVLRSEVKTAGVALASVPKEKRAEWFRALIAQLSHSHSIDVALNLAAREHKLAAPLLVCSRQLAERATLREFTERLGATMKKAEAPVKIEVSPHAEQQLRIPPTAAVEDVGATLESNASRYDYQFETGDATAIVETREAAETAMAERIEVPRMSARPSATARMTRAKPPQAMPPPPPPPPAPFPDDAEPDVLMSAGEAPPEERFVRASFFDSAKSVRQTTLPAATPCFVRVHIGPPGGEGVTADEAFDESKLPPSDVGHELTIALFELREDDRGPASPPARATVFLPPSKSMPSTFAWFPVLTPAKGVFAARVVVLYEARVLETLLLRAPVGADESTFTLEEENVIRAFDDLELRRPFDAALVVNKAGGKPAVMGVAGKSVLYDEPVGIASSIEAIGTIVGELTSLPDKVKLDDDEVVSVLVRLARHGRLLHDWIAETLPPALAIAERIQVVEARLGAFLPLEFVYSSFAPNDGAKLCAHGKKELAAPRKTKCPNEKDRKTVCPSAFWGFSRVIERWPHMELNGRDFRLGVPKAGRMKLQPLESALVGASSRVSTADVKSAMKAVKPLLDAGAQLVADWDDWPAAVEQRSPSMLILFPHSEEKDGISALEIGKEFLQVSSIECDYVRPESRDPGPLVLLLGCSTQLPRVAFHDFVSRFRMKGASIVVGTLSLIRGRHATQFVKEFLAALKSRAGTKDAVFGDVLLEAKQKMLAAGDPFALTLVAYGDADWRL